MNGEFDLLLFSTDAAVIRPAVDAGIDGIVVDWECQGKLERQRGADTQINQDTADDLRRVRAVTAARIICRINSVGEMTRQELEVAIAAGATEVLLPMVRGVHEVEAVLRAVDGRCGVGILIETMAATRHVDALATLPLSRVFVGLNDLAIERGAFCLFSAVVDGTVERVRQPFRVPFGFGGLTLPDRGHPIPCRLLIGEMIRLGCAFSFLRRSFHRDMRGRAMQDAVPEIRLALAHARRRPADRVAQDRAALEEAIMAWV